MKMLADQINIFFQGVSKSLLKPNSAILPPKYPTKIIADEYNIPVIEIEKQLIMLDTKMVPGLDNIPI